MSADARARPADALSHPRDPDRGRLLLVLRPLPDHPLALGLLPRAARRRPGRAPTPICSRSPRRSPSSARSCCTSSVTPSSPTASASRSPRSRCGCSAASPGCRRTPSRRAQEFKIAAAGPAVTALIAVVCGAVGIAIAGGDYFFDAMRVIDTADTSGPARARSPGWRASTCSSWSST